MIRKIPLKWRNPFSPVASGSEPFVLKFPFLKNYFLTSPLPNFQPLAPRSKPFRFQFSTKKKSPGHAKERNPDPGGFFRQPFGFIGVLPRAPRPSCEC